MRTIFVCSMLGSLLFASSSLAETQGVTRGSASVSSPAATGSAKWDGTYKIRNPSSVTGGLYCSSDDKAAPPVMIAGGKASFPVWIEEQYTGAITMRQRNGTPSLPAISIHDVVVDANGASTATIPITPDLVAAQRTRASQPGPYQNKAIATAVKVVTEAGRGGLVVTVTEVVEKPESHPTPPSCDFQAVKQ